MVVVVSLRVHRLGIIPSTMNASTSKFRRTSDSLLLDSSTQRWRRRMVIVPLFASAMFTGFRADARVDPHSCVSRLAPPIQVGQLLLPLTGNVSEVSDSVWLGLVTGLAPTGTVTRREAIKIRALRAEKLPLGMLVASDEEGGLVQRYRKVIGPLPNAATIAATLTPEEASVAYGKYARVLKSWGVDIVFAPVLDVGGGPGIESRSFSTDYRTVTTYGRAAAMAFRSAGLVPVFKHFPGHGSASRDTHLGAASTARLEKLRRKDLIPYQLLREFPDAGVMIGHLIVPETTNGLPATMSAPIIRELLRESLGFNGLVFSDALGMAAISGKYSDTEAAVAFLNAGGDVIVVSSLQSALRLNAAIRSQLRNGQLSSTVVTRAAVRVLHAKGIDACSVLAFQQPRANS